MKRQRQLGLTTPIINYALLHKLGLDGDSLTCAGTRSHLWHRKAVSARTGSCINGAAIWSVTTIHYLKTKLRFYGQSLRLAAH